MIYYKLVCSAFPYATGPLHFGRVGGSLLPADIMRRYYELCNIPVKSICATDCYGSPILAYAKKNNVTVEQALFYWHDRFTKTLKLWNIIYDEYSATHCRRHINYVQNTIPLLKPIPCIYKRLYCTVDKKKHIC